MAPHDERKDGSRDQAVDGGAVAKGRFPGEDGKDLRHGPHGREHQDIDLRMAEEPKQVLPQQGLAAALREEEVAAEHPIGEEHGQRRRGL